MTCPACLATSYLKEILSVTDLAAHWSRTMAHGDATKSQIADFVREDIGGETVEIFCCPVCSLEFARPARTWSSAHYPHEPHSLGWDHAEALRMLDASGRKTVLDVGCATGQFLEQLIQRGHTATGIDFSEEDVGDAREKGCEAYVADLSRDNELLAGNRRFQAITLFQVIEHLEEHDLVFNGIAKLAAPGALLIVGCPSPRRYTRGFRHPELVGSSDFWDSPPQHVFRWTPEALTRFASRHGWMAEKIAFEPLHAWHAAAHLAGISATFGLYKSGPWARRAATLGYFLRLKNSNLTGIRMFWAGRLSG